MPSLKHIHTYYRIDKKKNEWGCKDPYCTHVTESKYILGKASKCCKCGNELRLMNYDLRLREPMCINCSNRTVAKEFREKKETIESLFKEEEPTV